MLRIRGEQIRAFQQEAETAFVRRVMDYLRENHADESVRLPGEEMTVAALPARTLRTMVEGGLERARSYGFEWKSSLIAFVVLMFIGAPNFDETQKVALFMRDPEIPIEERIDRVMEEMSDEDWDKVEESYETGVWRLPVEEARV